MAIKDQVDRQYRKRQHNVSLDNLERIAQAFEVPIAELLNPDFNLRIERPQVAYFAGAAYG